MTRKKYVFYFIVSFLFGSYILSTLLDLLGVSSFADVLEFIFGEPNMLSILIVGLLIIAILFFTGRNFYKEYKKLP
jgi:hypothetical protein